MQTAVGPFVDGTYTNQNLDYFEVYLGPFSFLRFLRIPRTSSLKGQNS